MDKLIQGSAGYTVSINGEVKRNGNPVNPRIHNSNGRQFHVVTVLMGDEFNRVSTSKLVHRLVAEYWLNKPDSKEFNVIQHKDGNTLNNKAFNLRWVRRKDLPRVGNGRLGKRHTDAAKQVISKRLKGANNPRNKGSYICGFARFETAKSAAKTLKVSINTVIRRCTLDSWREKGWYFMPK